MTSHFKFLAAGQIGPFSAKRWSADWLSPTDVVAPGRGVYACRVVDLPYWIHDELWQVELTGPVVVGQKVAARRGRLVARISAWHAATAARLGLACVGRTLKHAAVECGDGDDGSLVEASASLLTAAEDSTRPASALTSDDPALVVVAGLVRDRQERAARQGRTAAALICGYVGDAVGMAGTYPVAMLAYVAARAAACRTGATPGTDLGVAEREWQAEWLTAQLDLTQLDLTHATP